MNEEKEQLSPVSILECPFQDDDDDEEDAITDHISHQKGNFINNLFIKYVRNCYKLHENMLLELT